MYEGLHHHDHRYCSSVCCLMGVCGRGRGGPGGLFFFEQKIYIYMYVCRKGNEAI